MREKKQKRGMGITGKLALAIVVSVLVALAALLVVVYLQMSKTLLEKSEDLLQTTTDCTIQETVAWMNKTLTMLDVQRDTIEYENMNTDRLRNYIRHTSGHNDSCPAGLYVALIDGTLYHASFVPGPDYDPLSRGWYQDGLKSDSFRLGEVYIDEDTKSYVVGASAVLRTPNNDVRGVAAADIYLDSISKIVSQVQLEETGGIFLMDTNSDIIIGHRDSSVTGKKLSELHDSMYEYVAQQIRANQTGLTLHNNTYIQVSDVPDSDWKAVTYVSRSEVLEELAQLTMAIIVMAIVAVIAIIILVIIQVKRVIGRPVAELSQAATCIAEGDLDQSIRYQSTDELGVLANDFNRVTVRLRDYVTYIDEISRTLHEIAAGNLTFTLKNDYAGEFEKIKVSLEEISYALNGTMGQIRAASKDVAAGADQVSSGAMTLSQGATEQASSVDALADHINSVSDSVQKTAQSAQEASDISHAVRRGLLESNEKMQNMTEVIQRISDNSNEIHKIIKTIEDIAFQTNILALNAAVEAARAGTAGKGFAVVADEVRSLAGKSANAAKETTVLLKQTVESMAEGVRAAQDTGESVLAVVEQADRVSSLISGIAERTKEQAAGASEISTGIDQISIVVQNNVATAEASAAASEELSGQAAMLKELVARFQLKNQ